MSQNLDSADKILSGPSFFEDLLEAFRVLYEVSSRNAGACPHLHEHRGFSMYPDR